MFVHSVWGLRWYNSFFHAFSAGKVVPKEAKAGHSKSVPQSCKLL